MPDLLVAVGFLYLIPWLSLLLADLVHPPLAGLDPDGTFLWISLHHVAQLLLAIVAMVAIGPRDLRHWGFNLENWQQGLRWIAIFFLVFATLEGLRLWGKPLADPGHPLTTRNVLGVQFFQYTLSGLGEEPLFRGLVMVWLTRHWGRVYRPLGIELPQSGLIATLLFMIAHVVIDPLTLTVSGFDLGQQVKALQLGLLYAVAFHYTRSLLAPVVMHGLSNGVMVTLMFHFSAG
ncbi:MAG: CPBP family intramembrane glutamic endopeptidase [Acidobacteriota bacterium]